MLLCRVRTKRVMYYVLALVSPTDLVGEKWLQNLLYLSSAGGEGISSTLALQQKFVVLAVGKKSTKAFLFLLVS